MKWRFEDILTFINMAEAGSVSNDLLFRHRKGEFRLGQDQLHRQAGAQPESSRTVP